MRSIKTFLWLCVLAIHAPHLVASSQHSTKINSPKSTTIFQNISLDSNSTKNTSLATSFGTDLEPYPSSLGIGYVHSFMQTRTFSIQTIGTQLQYTRSNPKYRGVYSLNLAHSSLKPKSASNATEEALHIGLFSAFDIGFANSEKGGILLGVEGGIGSGIAKEANNGFDESSLLLNADIGYILKLGALKNAFHHDTHDTHDTFDKQNATKTRNLWLSNLLIYPYLRLEQYMFLPHTKSSKDRFDYGLNGILGVKFIGDFRAFDWWVNLGILSDFNASGNGIGVLGDNSIVYDKDGISNGILSDIGLNILNNRSFALQGRFSINYALNYYELNLKGSLVALWQF
ncbi:hypothetical protein [Helicobacter sp. T3_23-1056]